MSAQGVQSEREQDREGPIPAMRPSQDRTIESVVTSVPPSFSSFFSFDAVVHALARWRVRVVAKRRDQEFYAVHFAGEAMPADKVKCDVAQYLPPRNAWRRPGYKFRRGSSSDELAVASILRTVYGFKKRGTLATVPWGRNLLGLLDALQARLAAGVFPLAEPNLLFREKAPGSYRCLASFGDLVDKLVIKGTTGYLKMAFDPQLSDRCHSFRVGGQKSHQTAIQELVDYRRRHLGETLFVAECDIQKFFDVLDHREVLRVYDAFAAACPGLDPRARRVVEAYLAAYDFEGRLAAIPPTDGRFRFCQQVERIPSEVLDGLHGSRANWIGHLGLPQGGSLSPLIANMVLTEADRRVMDGADDRLFYVRFCDDMVIVHPERDVCAGALKRYMEAVAARKLPLHEIAREGFAYGADFFGQKSKGPFRWEAAPMGARNASPWVSFLGNQIAYDGGVRIRPSTIANHGQKLRKERAKFMLRIGPAFKGDFSKFKRPVTRQSLIAIFSRYCSHMVAKGVGFMKAGKILPGSLCWAAAFPQVTAVTSRHQMRALDAFRDKMLKPFSSGLRIRVNTKIFFGRPFSYYGYLLKLARPTQPIPGKGGGAKMSASDCLNNDFRYYGEIGP